MIPLYTQEEFDNAKSRQLLPLQCKHCGKTFYKGKNKILTSIANRQDEKSIYCSISCSTSHRNPKVFVKCEQCENKFLKKPAEIKKTKHHFCSKSCSTTWNNAHKKGGTRCSKLEKWLATQLPQLYPNLEFHLNRKDAINSELDIYIPSLKLAFELNGIFHYEPIYGEEKLLKTKNNDHRKIQACLEQGIELCIIDVSRLKYFKEPNCIPYLEIIKNIISLKTQTIISSVQLK